MLVAWIAYFMLLLIGIIGMTAPLWLGDLSEHARHGDRLGGDSFQSPSAREEPESQGRDQAPPRGETRKG